MKKHNSPYPSPITFTSNPNPITCSIALSLFKGDERNVSGADGGNIIVNIKFAYTKLSTLNTKPQLYCQSSSTSTLSYTQSVFSYTPQCISYIIKDSSCLLFLDFLTLLHPNAENLTSVYEFMWMDEFIGNGVYFDAFS